MIFGADTMLGAELIKAIKNVNESGCKSQVDYYPRSIDFYGDANPVKIHRDISDKRPAVIVNAMLAVDELDYPEAPLHDYVASSLAILQRARMIGARLVYLSSCRVYGQEYPPNSPGYTEYDPWIAYHGDDPWRLLLQSVEATLFQQTSRFNRAAATETHERFEMYCLRLGHVLYPSSSRLMHNPSLSQCIHAAIGQKANSFSLGSPNTKLTPVDLATVVACVLALIQRRPVWPSGTYNIASSDQCTVRDMFGYLMLHYGVAADVKPLDGKVKTDANICGLDTDQSLDSRLWGRWCRQSFGSWQSMVDQAMQPQVSRISLKV
jgi:nucleoside-diphosphate-sugar epimerase